MKRWKNGFILFLICICYGLSSLYSAYTMLSRTEAKHDVPKKMEYNGRSPFESQHFDIWDTCGVGVYLWKHIIKGDLMQYNLNNGWLQSSLDIRGFHIRYNLGYGLSTDQALLSPESNLVLVINGRASNLVPNASQWLKYVIAHDSIKKVIVLLLGNEQCENDWIKPYMTLPKFKSLFLIYDSPMVDNNLVFQWPLGVASYRNFPNFDQEFLDLTATRPFVFNFVGTVYPRSSRESMLKVANELLKNTTRKYLGPRENWTPEEGPESMINYQHIILGSDLTLSPVGKNSECYRTYEAMELGSIPVIEDIMTKGSCATANQTFKSPYRLLKEYNLPVIYVKDWKREFPHIVEKFKAMKHETKVRLRINLIRWYVDFKAAMLDKFLTIVENKFFKT